MEMFGVEKRDKMSSSGYVPDNKNLKKSSGTPNLFFDSRKNIFFKRDEKANKNPKLFMILTKVYF